MKKALLMVVLLLTPGCAPYNFIQGEVADRGGDIADESLQTGIFLVCPGSTNGAVSRHFNTPDEWQRWLYFCQYELT